ncbi:MAG: GH92 family glycosyl hydrolase [Chitinophagaceae bacterium]
MMKKRYLTFLLGLGLTNYSHAQVVDNVTSPVDYVNPLMGADSKFSLSNGNTYPAIGLPWGMNMWTPQTGKNGDGWQYVYAADKIRGFKQTHQPSPWMNDYGVFSIMPITGNSNNFDQDKRESWFSHKAEISKPYYYSVFLADHDVTTELTTTERAAMFRFTFPQTDSAFVVVDAFAKGSYVKVIPSENKIVGYSTQYARGPLPKTFKNYFVVQFDRPFTMTGTWSDTVLYRGQNEIQDKHVGAIIGFPSAKRGEKVIAKVASSFISAEQADINLEELGSDNFDQVVAKGRDVWNKTLGAIEVSGGTDEQIRTFYSCMYRAAFFPNKLYEKDAKGNIVHWSPYNGQVLPGYMFAGTGFWDTFRALYPFLNLVYPTINKEMQEGLANDFKEGGFLPEWSSPGFADIMVGNNSASVVAEAYVKGMRGYDIETLWKALVNGANHEGPIGAVGRKGVDYYNKLGYVPYDVHINESAARTLEYAYDDYAIYRLGKALGKPESEIGIYAKRAMNYKNLYDPSHKLMRGKAADGTFQPAFDPYSWGGVFTEGNSWHYSWSVFQDIQGLIDLMGGKNAFVGMLDSVFVMPPVFGTDYYGGVIHEMREMQVMNMGQYAHGNQPIQHMTYLYNYAGQPWKAQYWIRQVMNKLYKPTPDGYCGDEDNGQTSAWYVFSALGFYPVTPVSDQYVLGAPLFKKAVLHLENGKTVTIDAPKNSDTNIYVQSLLQNGKTSSKNWVNHFDLLKGGTLRFDMASQPNKNRGVNSSDFPYSFSVNK